MAITKKEYDELCDARAKLCNFCELDELAECERCMVNHLVDDAYNECDEVREEDDEYDEDDE